MVNRGFSASGRRKNERTGKSGLTLRKFNFFEKSGKWKAPPVFLRPDAENPRTTGSVILCNVAKFAKLLLPKTFERIALLVTQTRFAQEPTGAQKYS
jgi:hypothetical protein